MNVIEVSAIIKELVYIKHTQKSITVIAQAHMEGKIAHLRIKLT